MISAGFWKNAGEEFCPGRRLQAPLIDASVAEIVDLIRARVGQCASEGVTILCCPEAILGGLAEHVGEPTKVALTIRRRSRSDGSLRATAEVRATCLQRSCGAFAGGC